MIILQSLLVLRHRVPRERIPFLSRSGSIKHDVTRCDGKNVTCEMSYVVFTDVKKILSRPEMPASKANAPNLLPPTPTPNPQPPIRSEKKKKKKKKTPVMRFDNAISTPE